jgi:hypothetical protein
MIQADKDRGAGKKAKARRARAEGEDACLDGVEWLARHHSRATIHTTASGAYV